MITQSEIEAALREAGVEQGMTVFSHANIAMFGRVAGADSIESLIRIFLDAFAQVLGPDGTLVLPVFTYSFGSDKSDRIFDVQKTLSTTSNVGNWLVSAEAGQRSHDPMLSVVATGRNAEKLTADVDPICFGRDSFWARLYEADGLICNLNLDSGSTYLHWVERERQVPYRSDIPMHGQIVDAGVSHLAEVVYTGRVLDDPDAVPYFEAYHEACVDRGVTRCVNLGRGQIVAQGAKAARRTLEELLEQYPRILTLQHKQ